MGEGGAVTGENQTLLERARLLRNHGMTREPATFTEHTLAFDAGGAVNPWHYEMAEPGLNYRASDIHCALGLSQLAKFARFSERRRALAAAYDARISALAPLVRPLSRRSGCAPVWHLYVVLIDFASAGVSRRLVMETLRAEGIGSQVHYIPVSRQPLLSATLRRVHAAGCDGLFRTLPLAAPLSGNGRRRRGPCRRRARACARPTIGPIAIDSLTGVAPKALRALRPEPFRRERRALPVIWWVYDRR